MYLKAKSAIQATIGGEISIPFLFATTISRRFEFNLVNYENSLTRKKNNNKKPKIRIEIGWKKMDLRIRRWK